MLIGFIWSCGSLFLAIFMPFSSSPNSWLTLCYMDDSTVLSFLPLSSSPNSWQTLKSFEGEVLSCSPFSSCPIVTGITAKYRVLAAINPALRQPPSLPSTARHQVCLFCSPFFFPSTVLGRAPSVLNDECAGTLTMLKRSSWFAFWTRTSKATSVFRILKTIQLAERRILRGI